MATPDGRRRYAGRRGSGCSAFFHLARPCAQRLCQLWHGGGQQRCLAEVRWHSRCARRARARDEKTSSSPRGPRIPLGDHTWTIAYRRLATQHAPARVPPLAPAPHPPTRSGARSANWPRHHLRQHAPARVLPTGPGTTSIAESVHEQCLLHPRAPAPLSPGCPSAERRRRWSHRTRARAQAACHRQPSPTPCFDRDAVGGEPRARSARRGTSGGGATGRGLARRGAAGNRTRLASRGAATTGAPASHVDNYA